jgi:hypothetical protein
MTRINLPRIVKAQLINLPSSVRPKASGQFFNRPPDRPARFRRQRKQKIPHALLHAHLRVHAFISTSNSSTV